MTQGIQPGNHTENRSGTVESVLGFDNAIKLGNLIETKIGHELNLVGQRMTWLVLSQSFLFVAFANVAGRRGARDGLDLWILYLLPVLGTISCVLVWPAVWAARTVARSLCEVRGRLEMYMNNCDEIKALPTEDFRKCSDRKDLDLPFLGAPRSTCLRRKRGLWMGDLPARFLPPALGLAWFSLLVVLLCCRLKQPPITQNTVLPTSDSKEDPHRR